MTEGTSQPRAASGAAEWRAERQRREKEAAALGIQQSYRGHRAWTRAAELRAEKQRREKVAAALATQTAYRGRKARKRAAELRAKKKRRAKQEAVAVVRIQAEELSETSIGDFNS